jgi:6-phosphogluconolactonase
MTSMRKIICSSILLILCQILINAQHTFVFIGSYNYDKNKDGIYVFELDTTNGNLTRVASAKNILNPSFLTLNKNGNIIYACTDTRTPKDGSLSSFEFNSAAKNLTFINTQKTGGENPVYITLDKNEKWLLSANYNDGSVAVLPVNKDGYISNLSQIIHFKDSSVNLKRQSSAHIHAAVFSPENHFVFLPDLGADKIRCFQYDTLQQQPLQNAEFPFTKTTSGSGPRHFTFHPNGKFAYSIEELAGMISVYQYEKGKLSAVQRVATHHKKDTFDFSSADIHISPEGKFLYASNRGDENNIAIFKIKKNGKLKNVGYQPSLGKTPRNFAIDEAGKFLIVANQSTGNIIVFKRNIRTGLLEKIGNEIKIENPTCVQIKKY